MNAVTPAFNSKNSTISSISALGLVAKLTLIDCLRLFIPLATLNWYPSPNWDLITIGSLLLESPLSGTTVPRLPPTLNPIASYPPP